MLNDDHNAPCIQVVLWFEDNQTQVLPTDRQLSEQWTIHETKATKKNDQILENTFQ